MTDKPPERRSPGESYPGPEPHRPERDPYEHEQRPDDDSKRRPPPKTP